MAKSDAVKPILEKVEQLDCEDELRRGILEKLADWLLCRKTSHRAKKWEEVEERAQYLKY